MAWMVEHGAKAAPPAKQRKLPNTYPTTTDMPITQVANTALNYQTYLRVLGCLKSGTQPETAGIGDFVVKQVLNPLKDLWEEVKQEFGVGVSEFAAALANKDVFKFFKSIKFNIMALFKGIGKLLALVRGGLFNAFEEMAKSPVFQKVRSGALAVDHLLEEHPILKKIAGPVLAALLFYMWLNMTFIGDFRYDFDLTDVGLALFGQYSIADLFASGKGFLMITLFAAGFTGVSFPWLASSAANLAVAIVFTGAKRARNTALVNRFKHFLQTKKV
jgi:hypothetical protein